MPQMTMGEVPGWHARRTPEAPAVSHGDDTLTWSMLARRAARRAHALKTFGVGHNDVVTIALPNGNDWFESLFAVWMVGATPNPVSSRLPAAELCAVLGLAQPRAVIGGDAAALPGFPVLPADWPERGEREDPLPAAAADCWKMIASGGSTGRPKLIVSPLPAVTDPEEYRLFDWRALGGRLGRPGGVMLNPGPLYHNGPMNISLANLLPGSHIVSLVRFDAEEVLRRIERHRVEFLYMVPTMMHRIWHLGDAVRARYDLSSLRGVLHLGASCPAWLKQAWIDWLGAERIWETYGSTEAIAHTLIDGTQWLRRRGSVGRFQNGARCRILDEGGNECPPGEIGEIWMMPAGGPDATPYRYIGADPRVTRDGWHALGDLGWMDAEGYLWIADRRADLILRGGANVYPAEVEAAIEAHPDVVASAVVGLPDEDLGARVHAIVELKPESQARVTSADLDVFVRQRLATYKCPESWEFATDSLRDEAGKIRRTRLRADRVPHQKANR